MKLEEGINHISSLEELLPAFLLCHQLVIASENLLAPLLQHYRNGTKEDKVFLPYSNPIKT